MEIQTTKPIFHCDSLRFDSSSKVLFEELAKLGGLVFFAAVISQLNRDEREEKLSQDEANFCICNLFQTIYY